MKTLFTILLIASFSFSARVKDVARIDGLEEIPLVGYGLVVGLQGTGDGTQSAFTIQTTLNLLRNMGIEVPTDRIRLRNVAAVMVTAKQGPFQKRGQKMDIAISSMGDARSLEGGVLLMTPMMGPDQEIYALAQGALSLGGSMASTKSGRNTRRKNHTLSGQIPNGASIQKELKTALDFRANKQMWSLNEPDFSSVGLLVKAINAKYGEGTAMAIDAASIEVNTPADFSTQPIAFISEIEQLEFTPNSIARVILNEKTGTIVAGSDVRISEVAVSHGNVTIEIGSEESVSQPNALSAGRTASVINEQLAVQEEEKPPEMKVLPAVNNAGELASALNSLGVHPRDIISIFQAIKKAGALHADLVLM